MVNSLPLCSSLVAYKGRFGGQGGAELYFLLFFSRGFYPKLCDLLKPYHLALKTLL